MKYLVLIFSILTFTVLSHGQTKPDATNTGHMTAAGSLEDVSGVITLSTPGETYSGKHLTSGQINVTANNVTITDCLLSGGGYRSVLVSSGVTGTVITYCTLMGADAEAVNGLATVRYCHFTDLPADGAKLISGSIFEYNLVERLGSAPGAHADGVQLLGVVDGITIRYNTFDMPPGLVDGETTFANSNPLMLQTADSLANILVSGNWINGGGWSIAANKTVSNGEISENKFGFDHAYGPISQFSDGSWYVSCNVWDPDETGTTSFYGNTYSPGDFVPDQDNTTGCSEGGGEPPELVATPAISPSGGNFVSAQSISLSTVTPDTTIYRTVDGTTPDDTKTEYTAPFNLSTDTLLRVIATDDNDVLSDSLEANAEFDFMPWTVGDDWFNAAIAAQTGTFSLQFEATPAESDVDWVIGFSSGDSVDFSDLAVTIRFAPDGNIDICDACTSGSDYGEDTVVAYSGGTSYTFDIDVDLGTDTFDVDVTPDGGGATTIITGAEFRPGTTGLASLDRFAAYASTASGGVLDGLTPNPSGGSPVLVLSNPILAADGQTLTATISGGDGTYTPSSGVTGLTVKGSGNTASIGSTAVSGSTLTVNLSAALQGGEPVSLTVLAASNLSDGDNTPQGQSDLKAINNSTQNNGYNRTNVGL